MPEEAPESIVEEGITAEGENPGSIADGSEEKPAGEIGQSDGKPAGQDGAGGENRAADWELAAPEDFPLPEDNLKSFVAVAKKLGLSKEQAEGMLGWHREFDTAARDLARQEQARVVAGWDREIMADREFGGANMKATVAEARKALSQFDPDGSLRTMLRETGYDRNPAIIRVVARVGRAMGEHQFVGQNGDGGDKAPLEERMYGDMKI